MPPKKGKGKKKGKKGGGVLGADPDNYKSFNVAQRQVLQQLFVKMRKNQEENERARRELKETKEAFRQQEEEIVSYQVCFGGFLLSCLSCVEKSR